MDIYPQRIVSLCSGVGWLDEGLRLGLEWFGFASRVVAYVERDSYAAAVLLARMADASLEPAPISDSIEDIGDEFRGCVDWLVAGFPCQPWSHAGKQQGADDERWLWPAIADCIRRVRPSGIFLENVPGLISGGGLEHVLVSLAEMGFDAEWGCLTAEAVGASHRRERVFIVADARRYSRETRQRRLQRKANQPKERLPDDPQLRSAAMGDASRATSERNTGKVFGAKTKGNRTRRTDGLCVDGPQPANTAVGHTECARPQGNRPADTKRRDIAGPSDADRGIFAPGPQADWRAIPEYLWQAIEPGFCELVDGSPVVLDASRADQLRCAGNGCMAIQAAAAFVELNRRLATKT